MVVNINALFTQSFNETGTGNNFMSKFLHWYIGCTCTLNQLQCIEKGTPEVQKWLGKSFVPVPVPIQVQLNADFWNFLGFMSRGDGFNANLCDIGIDKT